LLFCPCAESKVKPRGNGLQNVVLSSGIGGELLTCRPTRDFSWGALGRK